MCMTLEFFFCVMVAVEYFECGERSFSLFSVGFLPCMIFHESREKASHQ